MAFGSNMLNIQCFNSGIKKYTFQGNYKRVILVKNGIGNGSGFNFSLNDVALSLDDWVQITKTDYNGMALSYVIINDVKENDVLKSIGSSITYDYVGGAAIF